MPEETNTIISPRTLAISLYIFITINVILICIFLVSLMPANTGKNAATAKTAAVIKDESLVSDPITDELTKQLRAEEDNTFELLFNSAKKYIRDGDAAFDLLAKVKYYDNALLQLSKIPRRPKYQKEVNPLVDMLKKELIDINTVKVQIGDTQQELEKIYDKPDKILVLEKYFPKGSMKYYYYDKLGMRFGINKGRIYSIKFESNFEGIFRGIKINDPIHKVKSLFPGRTIPVADGRYGFQELDRKTTYVFVDNDDFLDGIEQFDKAIYGKWTTIFE
jgi:hypothetical protein